MSFSLPLRKTESWSIEEFQKRFPKVIELKYDEMETYCITPNNAPEKPMPGRNMANRHQFQDMYNNKTHNSDDILNMISSIFSKFYPPERIRFRKNGITIKMNDLVSYKILFHDGQMKFYLTVPKKWSKNFINAVRRSWGQVDITKVSEKLVNFNPEKTRAADIFLRHHYALSLKHDNRTNFFYPSLSSLGSTLKEDEKLLLDFNIRPMNETWKEKARNKMKRFKNGSLPSKDDDLSVQAFIGKVFNFADTILNELLTVIDDLFGAKVEEKDKEQIFTLQYSDKKTYQNTKGFNIQAHALVESPQKMRTKHILKGVEGCFETLDGDNNFVVKHIKTKRGIKSIIRSVENNKPRTLKSKDVLYNDEMNQLLSMPNKEVLKEFPKLIDQDNYTRTEINEDFLKDKDEALPFAQTLDKEPQRIYFPGYKRDWWTNKGRKSHNKTKLDDRSEVTLISGKKGSGKTEISIRQAVQTFGVQYSKEEWKEKSKSVVAFDVADGSIITEVYNLVPDWLKDRVIILNHANYNRPVPVNFSDIEEFNREVMKDEDFAYTLAEMEAALVRDIVNSGNSILVDRWFTTALQVAHMVSPDYGIAEAMRLLIDDAFRNNEIVPNVTDERMKLELEAYNELRNEGSADQIVNTIQNRLNQLERDSKLWDCMAQKPIRNEEGKTDINFRKWMDGDEDGAYMVLVYIPKTGVSDQYRKYLFAHYFLKVWNVALSREKGFASREYRPECLVVVDEIHQIIGIPTVANIFVDLFKEVRKYSLRYLFTLHGWSSLSKTKNGTDIKNAILDNGANLIMLEGGGDMFDSFQGFMGDYTINDFNNLMKMEWCGIFSIMWKGRHVFQAKTLLPAGDKKSEFTKYDDWDLYELSNYKSPYSRPKGEVRKDNLERIKSMLKQSIKESAKQPELKDDASWEDLKK